MAPPRQREHNVRCIAAPSPTSVDHLVSLQARKLYEAFLHVHPGFPKALLGLATACAFSGDFSESVARYSQYLSRDPTSTAALFGRAQVLLASGQVCVEVEAAYVCVCASYALETALHLKTA